MPLRVLEPGLYTLLVDEGRPASRSLGVPVGGAADRFSLAIGNALVGNPPPAPALEICLAGPALQADCSLACVLFGAPFDMQSDRHRLAVGHTFTLEPGETLRIGGTPVGMRAYFCVQGGLHDGMALGSRSSLAPLRADQELGCSPGSVSAHFVQLSTLPTSEATTLRVVAGAQADWFARDDFHGSEFTVTPASNRMGLRLQGPAIARIVEANGELVSEAVCPGAVQVTRDGQCIVLGVDGQTIGGYPKIAHVISADLDVLGQLRPRQRLRFVAVSLDEAEHLHRQRHADLHEWVLRLRASCS